MTHRFSNFRNQCKWLIMAIIFSAFCTSGLYAKKPEANKALEKVPNEVENSFRYKNMRMSEESGAPLALYRVNYAVNPDTPTKMAKQYLRENASLLKIKADLSDLEVTSTMETPGSYKVRFLQHIQGYPVYQATIVVTINRQNQVVFVMNSYKPLANLSAEAAVVNISQAEARNDALNYIGIEGAMRLDEAETIVYYNAGTTRLAQKVQFVPNEDKFGDWEVLVDAVTGEIFRVEDKAVYGPGKEGHGERVDGSGWVFDPDPLTASGMSYGGDFGDNGDNDTPGLTSVTVQRTLKDLTLNGSTYSLTGPYADIVDIESPFDGVFSQDSSVFHYTRGEDPFEAVNTYFHLDQSMRYINETLGFPLLPYQYSGGVKGDPHGLGGADNSHYIPSTGELAWGEGGVDDAEDEDVVLHELGHGLHDWLTNGGLSQVNGLSEGCGDYWAVSYNRSTGFWQPSDPQYNWVFQWDGHNEFWPGRVTDYTATYPGGLTGQIHTDGQIWASTLMQIYDDIGREACDLNFLEGLSMTNSSTNQEDAAQAFIQADLNNYGGSNFGPIEFWFTQRGYNVIIPLDPESPHAPTNAAAYSDYTTPNAIDLSWTDPTNYVNGDTLINFNIDIYRDGAMVNSVPGGTEAYTDGGLTDGQLYVYTLVTRDMDDTTSIGVETSAYAGGSPTPSAPMSLTLATSGNDLVANWTNPTTNDDGTPLDDFAGVNLYEDGALLATFNRTSSDSGAMEMETFTPSPGTHSYTVTAFDNESPSNESAPSNPAFPPISLPFADDFESGMINPGWWMNMEATVNQASVNPPSGTYALDLNGNVGGDVVTMFPVDLSSGAGQGYILSFWVQPQGTLNEPEIGDVFIVEFLNNQGAWVEVYMRDGSAVVPFENITIDIDNAPNGGGSYFYAAFQMRFRTSSSPVGDFDDYFVDNVFLGIPNNPPAMAVMPLALSDTVLVGGAASHDVTISNTATLPSSLIYTVTTDPAAAWLSVSADSGTVGSGNSSTLTVTMDASGLASGSYSSDITISGNDPNNPADMVTVSLQVNDAPVVGFMPDSLVANVEPGAMDTVVMTIINTGDGPLDFFLSDEDVSTVKNHITAAPRPNYPASYYGMDLDKDDQDPRRGNGITEGEGGPDAFGYTWIDSDEPDGPTYNWVDISATGTALDVNSPWIATGTFGGNDEGYIEAPLPFEFSYYGVTYNSVFIGTNGNVSFQPPTDNTFTNQPIPTAGDAVDNYLAGFVDDLEVDGPGTIYYGMDGNDFVIQYQDMPRFNSTTANYTFEYILKPTGAIVYQYDAMGFGGGEIESATIGIENADGTDGLQIAFNEAYVHDDLAILIAAGATWLEQDPVSGTVAPQSQMDINLIVDASVLTSGNYAANIIITSNDPVNSVVYAPISVIVGPVGIEDDNIVPLTYDISRNYPNPFNPTTSINYQVPEIADVSLVIYNVLGQRVKTLVNARIQPGKYQATWDAKNDAGEAVGSGIYIYRFEASDFRKIQKMILLK